MAPDSLIGLAPAALVHPDDLRTIQAAFMEASYFGRAASAEVRMKRADGTLCLGRDPLPPGGPAKGKARDIVAVTRDITERKNHEQRADRGARSGRRAPTAPSRASSPI